MYAILILDASIWCRVLTDTQKHTEDCQVPSSPVHTTCPRYEPNNTPKCTDSCHHLGSQNRRPEVKERKEKQEKKDKKG